MKFTAKYADATTATTVIEGDTLSDACESNIGRLVKLLNLGNAAGYVLDRAWYEYDKNLFDGNGGVAFCITAHGHDALIGYDGKQDKPRTGKVLISASESDLPESMEVEITRAEDDEAQRGDPFAESLTRQSDNYLRGVISAIIDEIGENHCKISQPCVISNNILTRYHNVDKVNPLRYMELCRKALTQRHPKADAETTNLLSRISDLAACIQEPTKYNEDDAADVLGYATTKMWFLHNGKITALAKYRKKAGLAQEQVASIVGITTRQYQRYESAGNSTLGNASAETISSIANAVGVVSSDIVRCGIAVLV